MLYRNTGRKEAGVRFERMILRFDGWKQVMI